MSRTQVRTCALAAAAAFLMLARADVITDATCIVGAVAGVLVTVGASQGMRAPGRSTARSAVFALGALALLELWMGLSGGLDTTEAVAIAIALDLFVGAVVVALLAAVALELGQPFALGALAAWTLGWTLRGGTLLWLVTYLFDLGHLGAIPDAGAAPSLLLAVGAVGLGVAAARCMVDPGRRARARAVTIALGVVAFATLIAQRQRFELVADAMQWLLLAVVLHMYERDKPDDPVPRATAIG